MSTTNGNMKSFKVTDKDGNVYVMIPVDTEARQEIDQAKFMEFDTDYFTSEVSQDQTTVNVGLNGVPLGIDSDSPLKFSQDSAQGVVISSDAPFATAIAPEYDPTSTYSASKRCVHYGKYYECNTAIVTAEAWNAAHWTEVNIDSGLIVIATAPLSSGATVWPDASSLLQSAIQSRPVILKYQVTATSHQYYYVRSFNIGQVNTITFYSPDNSLQSIVASINNAATTPVWTWSLVDTNVMSMIGDVETLLAAL